MASKRDRGGDAHAAGLRHIRLETVTREELGALLRDEVRDRALERARLGAVEVAKNLSSIRARLWIAAGDDLEAAQRAADRVTPFLRARLVDAIELKYAPVLRLSVARGDTDSLVDEPRGGDEEESPGAALEPERRE